MYSKTIIPLKGGRNGKFPSDEDIQRQLNGLGFELQYKSSPANEVETAVKITDLPDHKNTSVDIGSTWHHRDRAYGNLSKLGQSKLTKEIEKYAIYYGATSKFEASVSATRVNRGELCIIVVQRKLEQCARCTEHVLDFLRSNKGEIFDLGDKKNNATVKLYSTASGDNIASGNLVSRTFGQYLRSSSTETTVAVALLVLALLTFALGFFFPPYADGNGALIDPLTESGRVFVERAWPASIIASATAFITLRLSFNRISKDGVEWDWNL